MSIRNVELIWIRDIIEGACVRIHEAETGSSARVRNDAGTERAAAVAELDRSLSKVERIRRWIGYLLRLRPIATLGGL